MRYTFLLSLLLIITSVLPAQTEFLDDPCGVPDTLSEAARIAASGNWGYGYDTLLYDIAQWKQSPFVTVDSAGASVQGRTLFVLTVTDTIPDTLHRRRRVWIHARTHPNEVQGTWVTNEMIMQLLAQTDTAHLLRSRYVFNIMPMYNPDGVELGKARQNANNVDIESNWNNPSPQPEVLVLRSQFQKHMAAPNPMEVMLNMHSAYACKRYFVYHAPGGTSLLFSLMEQRFINYIRSYFPGGIEPYPYYTSWTTTTATQYPESWCWLNHKEQIMAMTYEDGNCETASSFDLTARAILFGINKYLQDTTSVLSIASRALLPEQSMLRQNYPNPFNPATTISYRLSAESEVRLSVHDLLGREAAVLVHGRERAGDHSVRWDASGSASGVYLCRLTANGRTETRVMHFLK